MNLPSPPESSSTRSAVLLAVVEVPKADRVICQAPGCKHSVFRRIHIVSENETLRALGSECFKKLFGEKTPSLRTPRYGTSDGRQLTSEERQLLGENTERLIEQFEAEQQSELQKLSTRTLSATHHRLPAKPQKLKPSPEDIQRLEAQAKEDVRSQYNIDPNLPGFRWYVDERIRELLD